MPRSRPIRPRARPSIEPLEGRALLASLMVTNILNAGSGSLRQAILDADAATGPSTIGFDIPSSGVQTINLVDGLPNVFADVTIDATTQPGYAGSPLVALDGARVVGDGLAFGPGSTGSVVKGLAFDRFLFSGIRDQGVRITVESNTFGVDPTGKPDAGSNDGIDLDAQAPGPEESGTVITGNTIADSFVGISLSPGLGVAISNNFIGTDSTGRTDLGNQVGIRASAGSTATISNNTISDNTQTAIDDPTNGGLTLSGNTIGDNGPTFANLDVVASASSLPAVTGQTVLTTYTVTNNGPHEATDVKVELGTGLAVDPNAFLLLVSPVYRFVGAEVSQGSVTASDPTTATLEVASLGTLAPGASARITVAALIIDPGTDVIAVTAAADQPTAAAPGVVASTAINATGTADLAVRALAPPPARVGMPETFTFVITNDDPTYTTDARFALSFGPTATVASMGVLTSRGIVTALPAFPNGYGGDIGRMIPGETVTVTAVIIPPASGLVSAALFAYSTSDADPAPANNLAFAASLATVPAPTLLGAVVEATGGTITTLSVYFDGALNASEAQNVNNYQLTRAGSTARIAIASATYPATPNYGTIRIVTLQLAKALPRQAQAFRLLVGRAGLTGADGSKLLNAVAPVAPTYD